MASPGSPDPEAQKSTPASANVSEVEPEAKARDVPVVEELTEKQDESLVDFADNDLSDPQQWSGKHKWTIVVLLTLLSIIVNLAILICAPAVPQILEEFHTDNFASQTLIVSIWQLGELVGPLISASLSEIYGRQPVLNCANLLFALFLAVCGLSPNIHVLLLFRFLTGMATITGTMNQPIVADMFPPQERAKAATVIQIPALLAVVVGPTIGSFLTEAKGWRWTFWLMSICAGAFSLLFLAFYRETYKVAILEKRARHLRKERNDQSIRSKYDEGKSRGRIIADAFLRPAKALVLCPAIPLVGVNVAYSYGSLYLVFSSLAQVFQDVYKFGQGVLGLAYIGTGVGMIVSMFACRYTLDKYYKVQKSRLEATGEPVPPEIRLPPVIAGGILLPIGFFFYGWTAQYQVHYIVPIIATGFIGASFLAIGIPTSLYLMDSFGIYTASASAAVSVLRFASGTVLPLAGPPLYNRLGVGWGNSVLGFVAIGMIPLPVFVMLYGKQLRTKWSKFETRE